MTEIMHGFGENGELSRGAELALDAYWAAHGGGGGGGGVTDHGALTGRDAPDQHPVGAVTGLQDALDGKAASTHTHTAAQTTSGTFAVARIPTGTSGSTVALGNHGHTPGQVGAQPAASGTPDGTKFLRDDNTWQPVPSGGGGGGPVLLPTATGRWMTNPYFITFGEDQYIRANDDMPLLVPEGMAIDAVSIRVTTAPSEATTAEINLLDASRVLVQKLADLPIDATTGTKTAILPSSVALSAGVYYIQAVGVGFGNPAAFGAKFACGKLIGYDTNVNMDAPVDATNFPRRAFSGTFTPVTPIFWVRAA